VNVVSSGGLGHLLQQMFQGSVETLHAGIATEGHVCQVLQVLGEERFPVHPTRIVRLTAGVSRAHPPPLTKPA